MKIPYSTQLLLDEAKSRGVEVEILHSDYIFKLTLNDHVEYLYNQCFSGQGVLPFMVCNKKEVTKSFLSKAGIKVAEGGLFQDGNVDKALELAEKIGWPIVLKPRDLSHGKNVFLSIDNATEFKKKWEQIENTGRDIIVEKMHAGIEYRILATQEKVIGAILRVPANVVGDGSKNIKQLIEEKNLHPRRVNKQGLSKIIVDEIVLEKLAKDGKDLDFIPKKGEQVYLRENSNISTGGDSIDVTDDLHPSVCEIAVNAVKAIPNLRYAGVDFLTEDISGDQAATNYIIIEANASPMISLHDAPLVGKSRNAAKEIINLVFPETV